MDDRSRGSKHQVRCLCKGVCCGHGDASHDRCSPSIWRLRLFRGVSCRKTHERCEDLSNLRRDEPDSKTDHLKGALRALNRLSDSRDESGRKSLLDSLSIFFVHKNRAKKEACEFALEVL